MQVALSGPDKLSLRPRSQARQDLPPTHIPLLRAPFHSYFSLSCNMSSIPHHPTRTMSDLPVSSGVRSAVHLKVQEILAAQDTGCHQHGNLIMPCS